MALTELLKKDQFYCNPSTKQAFLNLKTVVTTTPILTLPNFQLPFVLETGAYGTGIGDVLSQAGHPVAFYSTKLSPTTQKKYTHVC